MTQGHVERGNHTWEVVQHGGKNVISDCKVPSPPMLFPSCVHSLGKISELPIAFLHKSSMSSVFMVVYIIK